ncbi:hypothetical protein MLD38_033234 [Melastoma candidum]|uniref:Uncharacterized protein n=1 Tax=Melastoma candidum TaxID=119954 RepID=A0ACB9M632_9MYRT|nr:hypothetical protein MLD38_033234 [Melastoma candidum]
MCWSGTLERKSPGVVVPSNTCLVNGVSGQCDSQDICILILHDHQCLEFTICLSFLVAAWYRLPSNISSVERALFLITSLEGYPVALNERCRSPRSMVNLLYLISFQQNPTSIQGLVAIINICCYYLVGDVCLVTAGILGQLGDKGFVDRTASGNTGADVGHLYHDLDNKLT